MKTLKVQ